MVVVDAVDDPVHPRAEALLGLEVEHDPVQPVLEQRPQRVATDRQPGGGQDARARQLPRRQQRSPRAVKIITGTAGCTRERASSRRESNIGGEARSTSVLLSRPVAHVFGPGHIGRFYYPLAVYVAVAACEIHSADRGGRRGRCRRVTCRRPRSGAVRNPAVAHTSSAIATRLATGLRGGLGRGLGLAPGRPRAACRERRDARGELDDPEAHDPVGDPQRAVQVDEQLRRGVELQQVVLGAGLVIDRVGQRSRRPTRRGAGTRPAPRSPRARRRRSSRACASSAWGSSRSTRSYVGAGRVMRDAGEE